MNTIERCLFQTKHANPQHFLIEGERGIGKSSLFLYLQILASGRVRYDQDQKFEFLVVSVDLGQCETQVEIIREIGTALKVAIAEKNQLRELAKGVFDFLTNWELLGVKYRKEQHKFDGSVVVADLVQSVVNVLKQSGDTLDGILILIDEADRPPEAAGLGLFLKLFTERLTRKECGKCLIGLAGLPTLVGRLLASHESSPRVFEAMTLEPLEDSERKDVIEGHAGSS